MEDLSFKANEILYRLLRQGPIRSTDPLYSEITASAPLSDALRQAAAAFQCDVVFGIHYLFLVPQEDNNFLGMSPGQLKEYFRTSTQLSVGQRNNYFNLQVLFFIILLDEFYDTANRGFKKRDIISIELLLDLSSRWLRQAASVHKSDDGKSSVWENMLAEFERMAPTDEQKSSRAGVVSRERLACRLAEKLSANKLIAWDPDARIIRPLDLLDDQCEYMLDTIGERIAAIKPQEESLESPKTGAQTKPGTKAKASVKKGRNANA